MTPIKMSITERRERRASIRRALRAAGFDAQAQAMQDGELMPSTDTLEEREQVEAIFDEHDLPIRPAWKDRR
jgi:hypothetical protein